jgi:Flp pilus assembly protein TadG
MKIAQKARREDGAAAVEFALIVGVLAMLIFGMLQYGLAFFELQNLRSAAREGARIGAVGATATQVKQRVSDMSGGVLPANSGAVAVNYTSTGAWPGTTVTGATRACPPKSSQTTNSQTRVTVDLSSSSLPANLVDIFTLNIPLMPQISLRNATVSGVFRCEGN